MLNISKLNQQQVTTMVDCYEIIHRLLDSASSYGLWLCKIIISSDISLCTFIAPKTKPLKVMKRYTVQLMHLLPFTYNSCDK